LLLPALGQAPQEQLGLEQEQALLGAQGVRLALRRRELERAPGPAQARAQRL